MGIDELHRAGLERTAWVTLARSAATNPVKRTVNFAAYTTGIAFGINDQPMRCNALLPHHRSSRVPGVNSPTSQINVALAAMVARGERCREHT